MKVAIIKTFVKEKERRKKLKPLYNYAKLKGRIRESGITLRDFAYNLGITEQALHKKLKCQSYFTQSEMEKTINLFNETFDNIEKYFFTKEVAKIETKE